MKPEIDPVTGRQTTGHEWNGITELNAPLPKAFKIWLWISVAVSVFYWLLYPSFPTARGYLAGTLGYSSRTAVDAAVTQGHERRSAAFAPFETRTVAELAADPTLRARYEAAIAPLFRDNCAACHGREAQGQLGFPNLTDDQWLWSGTPEEIEYTLRVGINAVHDDTRYAEMLAFGRDGLLEEAEVLALVEYVLSLSGQDHDATAATDGAALFADNCASCHGEDGAGGLENGAPNLTDQTWIYGGSRAALQETIHNGRAGVMPFWSGRLSPAEIRQLTLYVLWQGEADGDS